MLIILIITQIIFESLPVSSSSHMRLVEILMARCGYGATVVPTWLDHLLHGPTILVLMIFFRREWWGAVKVFFTRRGWRLILKICGLSFFAVLIPVLFLYGVREPFLTGSAFFTSYWTLLGGLLLTTTLLFSLNP